MAIINLQEIEDAKMINDIGPLADLCETVLILQPVDEDNTTELAELFANELWEQIEKRIEKGGRREVDIALTFLIVCIKRTIEKSILSEDQHRVIGNIHKFLKTQLNISET